jgi:Arc/MetJ-type ribon-helix-helix transcriptional regulator
MSRNGFKSLTIPEGLYKEIEKYVEQSNGYYVSISEVVREAIRDYLTDKLGS